MIKQKTVDVFESGGGFSVEVLGRAGLIYREENKSLVVDSEILAGPAGMVIYKSSIKNWEQPYSNEVITEEKKGMIIENIKHFFNSQGFDIEIM